MPFGLVMSPTIIAAIVAIALQAITLGWGFVQSNKADKQEALVVACNAKHQAFKDQVEAAGKVAQVKAKWTEAKYEKVLDDTAKGWAAAIAVVRADAAKRLRDSAGRSSDSGKMPGVSQDRQETTGTNSDAIPSPARVAADCAETTVTANFLQSYIERLESVAKDSQ
jgi:hypothetical protein